MLRKELIIYNNICVCIYLQLDNVLGVFEEIDVGDVVVGSAQIDVYGVGAFAS